MLARFAPLRAKYGPHSDPLSTDLNSEPAKGNVMSKSKFRPLHDRVVVKRIDAEEKSKGGIIIPDSAKEKPEQGKIIAVGKGKLNDDGKLMAVGVKVGEIILFGKYSGSEVKLDGEEHLIMREEDILGVVEV